MAKWLVGCLALAVVVIGSVVWFGVRKFREFTGAGPTTSITIDAPARRVFASLANVDSMPIWRQVVSVSSSRKGMLRVGDTLRTQMRMPTDSVDRVTFDVVSELVPDRLLVLETVGDNANNRGILMIRRDSLVSAGDSTQLFTTFSMPATSAELARLDTSRSRERRVLDMMTTLAVSVARLQAGMEHRKLKARIEGTPMPTGTETLRTLPPARPPQPPRPPQ